MTIKIRIQCDLKQTIINTLKAKIGFADNIRKIITPLITNLFKTIRIFS